MPENITYPYNDEYMVMDKLTNHYVLTEAALLSRGIDLRARLSKTSTISPENVINNVLQTASDMIYQYIHAHNGNNAQQDYLIANVPSLRPILYRAMLYQAVYVCNVGNLYLSTDVNERAFAIDELAKDILNTVVPELGVCITYSGSFRRWGC